MLAASSNANVNVVPVTSLTTASSRGGASAGVTRAVGDVVEPAVELEAVRQRAADQLGRHDVLAELAEPERQ